MHVYRYGSGSRVLIAFHGFGESGRSFSLFEPLLPPGLTVYAPDLPLHGETEWKERYMEVADLEQVVCRLSEDAGAATFSLLGYSMGGKAALALTPLLINRMDHLILAAPDGLKPNRIYHFVTRNKIGMLLFRYVTHHPAIFRCLLACGVRFSLMNESIYKFVKHYMQDGKIRRQVFGVWNCMKKINPDPREVAGIIRRHQLPVRLYLGRYDRIFPPETGDSFEAGPSVRVKIVEGGHQLITPRVAKDILSFLEEN